MSGIRSGHPVRELESLAKQIALPAENKPNRFPSFPALERTALMGFTQPATLEIPVGMDTKVLIARQATYPVWGQIKSNADVYLAQWQCVQTQSTQASGGRDTTILDQVTATAVGSRTASVGLAGVVGGAATFVWPIMGEDLTGSPNPYLYIPENWNLYFVANFSVVTPNTGSIAITYEEWTAPGQNKSSDIRVAFASGVTGCMSTASTTASGGRWVRPINCDYSSASVWAAPNIPSVSVTLVAVAGTGVYSTSGANAGTITVTGADTRGLLPLVYPTEFVNSQLPWMSTRLTAVGALFTNVTQVLNKGGTVMAGRINPATYNPFSVSKAVINTLHPAEKAFLALETGLYTYCPPSTDMAEFWDYVLNTSNGAAGVPVYRLDNAALTNIAFFTPGSVAEAMAVNASWHMEFRTTSALFQVGMSGLTLESLHQAQLSLSKVGFFFENPNYVGILRRVIASVRSMIGPVSAAYKAYNSYGREKKSKPKAKPRPKLVIMVPKKNQVPKNGPMKVPTTSGQRSGIVAAKRGKAGYKSGLDMALAKHGIKH